MTEPKASDVVLDVGCGDGHYLGSLASQFGFSAHGIDISVAAIEAAARRYLQCEWVVANADRFVPYREQSFSLLLSITARQHAPELRRVLRPNGRLLVALPGPDDLVEIRGFGHDRTPRALAAFAQGFRLLQNRRITDSVDLTTEMVQDVLLSIYRPMQSQPVRSMPVTLSLDLLLFQVC